MPGYRFDEDTTPLPSKSFPVHHSSDSIVKQHISHVSSASVLADDNVK
jgi:hypothetical protein